MGQSWLPMKDADLLAFAQNASTKISASPTTYGLVVGDATTLATLFTSYQTALAASSAPGTRTPVSLAAKDVAKAALVADLRALNKRVQATATVTPVQRMDLGFPVHKTTLSPIPAPVTKPIVSLVGGSSGRSLTIRLVDETTPTKRSKPFGVDGAEVYSYVPAGTEAPPADLEKWRFEGIAKRATFEVDFEPEDVGKTSYVLARWFNPRGEAGAVSAPVTATIAA